MKNLKSFIIIGLFVLVCGGIIVTAQVSNVQVFNPLNLGGVMEYSLEDTRDIGYEFLDNGEVVHIWNNAPISDYYFNKDSGIQLTNHYEDYWTRNIFCIGYYNNDEWHKIACADELTNFQKSIETDNETYVNATLWKDIEYNDYDLRLGVQYHLGLNDDSLSITIYGKNIGIDIPFDIGFAWKVTDWEIPHAGTIGGDSIRINNTDYELNGTYNLLFKDMKKSYTNWTEDEEGNFLIDNGLILEPIPTLRGFDYSHYLNIDWNENLNYAVKMFGNRNQEDFYVALLINAGHFNPQQEKSTTFYWIDATTEITTWAGLQAMNSGLTGDYLLMNDLGSGDTGYDTYASSNANGGAGWLPIGVDYNGRFRGTFDGGNHTISDLYINRPTTDNIGLFGYVREDNPVIQNIGLLNLNYTGEDNVGGIIGMTLWTSLSNSYAKGEIYGVSMVGGLIGQAYECRASTGATGISYSYADVNISASSNSVDRGGLLGRLYRSELRHSYSKGIVNYPNEGSNGGGLVGGEESDSSGYPDDVNFWDKTTSGWTTSVRGVGKTTTEMQTLSTFDDAGWDIGTTTTETVLYPELAWEEDRGDYTWLIYTPPDTTPPTYSNNQANTTVAGANVNFSIIYDDNTALEPGGSYIFSTNNTGTWINESIVSFTSTPQSISVIKTLNSTVGLTIAYRWYANDSVGNNNNTPIYYLTTTEEPTPSTNVSSSFRLNNHFKLSSGHLIIM